MNTLRKAGFLGLDKRGGIWGAAIGGVILLLCCVFYSWKDGLVFAALFTAAGFIKLQPKHPASGFLLNALWALACIFLSCALPTKMVSDVSYLDIGYYRVIMNYLCAAVVYGLFLVITGNIKWAVGLASGVLLLLSTANCFVYQFRGNLLSPSDILSVKTAMNVVRQYVFTVHQELAYCWFAWMWSIFVLHSLPPYRPPIARRWFRLGVAALTLLSVLVLCQGTTDIKLYTWGDEGATRNGYLLNFTLGLKYCFPEQPEDYSQEALDALEAAYPAEESAPQRENLPNILVIMSESYADFSILGSELRTNQPVTPFLDSLEENTIRGYALSSVFGGTTANSEFEFLTGLSMANLPEGCCPYQQYINTNTPSLVQWMNTLGYRTIATHPYFSSGWNRTQVYPLLGFSEMTFDEDYPYQDLIREFVSDREMYSYVLNVLEETEDQPLFLFGITMQNHGDYIYTGENYEQTIFLEGYEKNHPMAEQYLTLLHETDKATEYLLTELERFPEDTIVLFFGDHFPQVEGDFFLEVHGGTFDTLSEQMLQFSVPFFIWANFDIPEQRVECTSLNYLGRHLLEAAGIALPPYYQFLGDLEEAIPAINAQSYYSLSQQAYLSLEDAQGEERWWLNQYAILQYNCLFDSDRSAFFHAVS